MRRKRITFVHRDFHPANVLWQEKGLSGVVDWVNACIGPAEVDVAHCRVNLALLMGLEAADGFLKAYEKQTRHPHDFWRDLNALANAGFFPDPPTVYPG